MNIDCPFHFISKDISEKEIKEVEKLFKMKYSKELSINEKVVFV